MRTRLGASYTWNFADHEIIAGALAAIGPEPLAPKLSLEARLYPEFP